MSLWSAVFDRAFHAVMRLSDRLADAWYGVSTWRERRYDPAEAERTRFRDPQTNMAAYYLRLFALRRHLAPGRDDVFVDLGCGAGRALFVFAAAGIACSRGLDFHDEALRAARVNARRFRRRAKVEIVAGDAAEFRFSDETLVFLFNPFGDLTLRAVLANLRASLAERPRRVRIGYYHPVHRAVFEAQPWLKRSAVIRGFKTDILVYETRN